MPSPVVVLALVLLGTSEPPPEGRCAFHFDGMPVERVVTQGRSRFLFDPEKRREGRGALLVEPAREERFVGVTAHHLPAWNPTAVSFSVWQDGKRPVRYRVKLDGFRKGAAIIHRTCHPGWNHVTIPLAELKTRRGGLVDTSRGLRRLQFSRGRGKNPNGFVIDDLRFLGEGPANACLKEVRKLLRDEDGRVRARAIRELLPAVAEDRALRILEKALKRDEHESVRRAAREALSRHVSPAALDLVIASARKARGERRLEWLWTLASLHAPGARRAAFQRLAAPKTSVSERTALIHGLTRRDTTDLEGLVTVVGGGAEWQPQIALIRALERVAPKDAVEALIRLLPATPFAHVRNDAVAVLRRITGHDLGTDVKAWRSWWDVEKERFGSPESKTVARKDYGGFFGIPITDGRIVFVLDISGSMRELIRGGAAAEHLRSAPHLKGRTVRTRLDLAREELIHACTSLTEKSHVGVVVYNDETWWLTKGLEPLSADLRGEIAKRLRRMGPGQRTNVHDGVYEAFHPRKRPHEGDLENGPDTIFLLSDGHPSAGPIRRHGALRDAILRWNLGRAIKIHTVNVGDANAAMLRGIAEGTGGRFVNLRSERRNRKKETKD